VPALPTCRAEIEGLHDFFVEWYAATVDEAAFDRLERALAPDFEMVTPDGERRPRSTVLDSIRASYGRDEPGTFDIEIRNVEAIEEAGRHATVRYEEWQESSAGTTGRISTVLFREDPDAPGGVAWVDLHETWLD
jgi:hypothetical protein